MIRFTGIRNGKPQFDVGDSAPPKWLIEAISPVAGRRPVKAAIVLFVKDGELQNRKGRKFKVGDEVKESDFSDRQLSDSQPPKLYTAID